MHVSVQACGPLASNVLNEVIGALCAAGMEADRVHQWPPEDSCILLFDTPDTEVNELIQKANHSVFAVSSCGKTVNAATCWELMANGAADVLTWNGRDCANEIVARLRKRSALEAFLHSPLIRQNLIGRSRAWHGALEQVILGAVFSHDAILLTGESGTGKELAARLVHALDQRPTKKDLIVVDCTTLMPELAGSELFGHEKGAFTGAISARAGAIQLANEGTLFLDEIGELSPTLQAQLLRSLQEKTYKRVGGNQWQSADFRLVCATNRDLRAMVEQGTFRRDLYYRIASVPITLPSLRERVEDVIPLARHFLKEMSGGRDLMMDPAVESYLISREYPGNVRDLRQLIGRILQRHCGTEWISPASLPEQERPCGPGMSNWPDEAFAQSLRKALYSGVGLQEIAREAKEAALQAAMELEDGSVKRAAERLGVTERAVQMRRAKGPASISRLGERKAGA